MRILLSNDDGIHAPGIQTLAKALREFAEVQVVAPDRNRSGASNSLTLESSLRTFTFENGDIAVQMGTPTDCVYLGVNALMRPRPDIVVSGINAGPNLGDDVIYSGTVAAAMEGRHLGFPALAVSLNGYQHYDTAAAVTCTILRALSREPLRTGRILNINVPDLPLDQIKGIRVTRCGNRHPADQVIPQQDPRGNTLYWIGPPGDKRDAGPGTDFAAVDEGVDALSYLAHARNHGFQFQLGSVVDINREGKTITLGELRNEKGELLVAERKLPYDTLVMALGSTSNDFNTPGVKENCIFLDNPHQARRFHQEMLNLFLKYSANLGANGKVNIAIVGGGATGVELSAELHNAVKQLHSYGYKGLTNEALNVTLVEAGERILPALPPRISGAAHNELTKLGVRVLTQTMVTSADAGGLHTKDGEYIEADLMVWAAGIKAPDFMKEIGGLETNRINQLVVEPTLQTTRDADIFAIGDCASCARPEGGFVPPRAQAAHQMATCALNNILAQMKGKPLKAYTYKDHGSLVSLSNYSTVGSLMGNLMRGSMMVEGRIARFVYISLYRMHQIALHGYFKTGLMMLVGRINRIIRPRLKLH